MAGGSFDPSGTEQLLNILTAQFQKTGSLSDKDFAEDLRELVKDMAENYYKLTEKEIHKIVQVMLRTDQQKFGSNGALTRAYKEFEEGLVKLSKKVTITGDLLGNLGTGWKADKITKSKRAEETGVGEVTHSTTSKEYKASAQAQKEYKELAGVLQRPMDSVMSKLLSFLRDKEGRDKVTLRHLGEDVVEGLAKSKFIGGAFMDLVKMISFFVGGFLKQFGPIGKALAVGVVALAPVLGTILVNLFTRMLTKLLWAVVVKGSFNLMGNLLKGLLNPANWARAFSFLRGVGGAVGGNLGRGALALGRLAGPAALVTGGVAAVGLGIDSLRKDGGREKTAGGLLTAGGLGLIVAGIGLAVGAAFAPVTAIIAGIAAGIGLIVKFWPKIVDWLKAFDEKFNIITNTKNLLGSFWDWFRNLKLPWLNGKDHQGSQTVVTPGVLQKAVNVMGGKTSTGTSAELLKDVQKGGGDRHLDPTKFTEEDWKRADTLEAVYGEMGEIINLGQMSQKRASEVIAADIAQKGDKSYYELVGNDIADWSQFRTDARAADGTGVYMARGFSNQFRAFLDAAQKAGYDTSGIKITSGIGTLGGRDQMSSHTYSDSMYGHFGSNATTFDISKLINRQTGQVMTEKEAKELGFGGMYYYSEGDHDHWSFGQWQSQLDRKKAKTSSWSEWKKGFIESTEANLKLRKEELEKTEKDADADGTRTDEEKKRIAEAKQKYSDAYTDVQTVKNYMPQRDVTDYTGNFLAGHKLRDTINMTWLQQYQQ